MHDRGLVTLKAAFENAKQQRHAAFIPYFPIGYPDYETSLQVIASLAESGADVIEVGVPFSDPLADGPTIQAATQKALENGTTLRQCIQAIQSLREQGIQTPMVLMGYLNPFMAYGFEHLVDDACVAGIDGFVVPDMPADEAALFQPLVETAEMGLAHFLAPTSSPQRIRLAAEKSRGYIYLVSVTGVTGTSTGLPDDLVKRIADIRLVTQQPIAVGFGIRTPEHATAVGKIADGVIV
ncbi:MAG: tryptophan synthase subunit alpha, partial [Chloroflexi bacterium]|nr:tryptophan synthase subunit alpha [Chloroflexota bacterium]